MDAPLQWERRKERNISLRRRQRRRRRARDERNPLRTADRKCIERSGGLPPASAERRRRRRREGRPGDVLSLLRAQNGGKRGGTVGRRRHRVIWERESPLPPSRETLPRQPERFLPSSQKERIGKDAFSLPFSVEDSAKPDGRDREEDCGHPSFPHLGLPSRLSAPLSHCSSLGTSARSAPSSPSTLAVPGCQSASPATAPAVS